MVNQNTRRDFLRSAGRAVGTILSVPYFHAAAEETSAPASANDRIRFAAVGLRYQGSVVAQHALAHGDLVALCDADADILAKAREEFGNKAATYEDYRKMLERKDIDAVLIGTPDHWHTAMLIDACRAGKDVYCEKPLTLTIDEGKQIVRAVAETDRVVQVGSWQRSDSHFRLAAELVRAGRLGKVHKVTVVLGKNEQGGPFEVKPPPASLNWDLWQGQTPDTPYIAERCHYTFRWWYEYSGGQMTDWGAHHLDIAQWIIGRNDSGPCEIEGTATFPEVSNGYNVAKDFRAKLLYDDGAEIEVLDHGRNGLLVEGENGRLFVNRGGISGVPIEALKDAPLPRERFQLYAHDNLSRPERSGKHDAIINHMGNFVDCIRSREQPISDVLSQHRSISACHLANISMRLGRKLKWDPQTELFVDDEEANCWLSRPQRKGYEIRA